MFSNKNILGSEKAFELDSFASPVIPIDPVAQAFFDACATAGDPVTEPYRTYYNNLVIALRNNGMLAELDSLYVAGNTRTWSSIDIIDPSRSLTINNPYSGDFSSNLGFKGNSGTFYILTNYNPGGAGTWKYQRNDASFGVLLLENNSVQSRWDIGVGNAGYTGGSLIRCYDKGVPPEKAGSINSAFFGNSSYQNAIINSYCWIGWQRTGANTAYNLFNGVNIETNTASSTAVENNMFAWLCAYNGSFAGTSFTSSNRIGVQYAGSGSVVQNDLITAFNENYFGPINNKANLNNRIIWSGDSRTADSQQPALSNTYAYPRRILTSKGDGWCGVSVAKANERVQDTPTNYDNRVHPYINASYAENIFVLWCGTNDIEAGRTAAQIHSDIQTVCNKAKADGFKVIVVGEIDRNWTGSYAAKNTVRADLRTLMLADFAVATAYANIWESNSVSYADIHVDPYYYANFQNYLSAWYQADGIHPALAGSNQIGDDVTLALNLII